CHHGVDRVVRHERQHAVPGCSQEHETRIIARDLAELRDVRAIWLDTDVDFRRENRLRPDPRSDIDDHARGLEIWTEGIAGMRLVTSHPLDVAPDVPGWVVASTPAKSEHPLKHQ